MIDPHLMSKENPLLQLSEAVSPNVPNTAAANDSNSPDGTNDAMRGAHANANLRRVIATRLVRARQLSGLSQGEVAAALSYKNQTQLSLWEAGTRLIPLPDLIRVAEVLHVPESYLLGSSDETERDPSLALRQACLRGVRQQLGRVAEITCDEVARHARAVGPHAATVSCLAATGVALADAMQTFYRLNVEAFETLPGGATVLRCIDDFDAELLVARKAVDHHNALDSDLRRALAEIDTR